MMQRKIWSSAITTGALCSGLVLAACGGSTAPTQRLLDARAAYEVARTTPGAELENDEMFEARKALRNAEAVHNDAPRSDAEIHYAYLAERRSNLAAARAEEANALKVRREAEQRHEALQAQLQAENQRKLAEAQLALEASKQTLNDVRSALAATGGINSELLKEMLSEGEQGPIITLSGSVVFPTGESSLLPIAEESLRDVAQALSQLDPTTQFVVEGHTDSVGTEEMNESLSQDRAESVRQFLITNGMDGNRIRAVGKGESEPTTTNDTAEGRANNRRVEIEVFGPTSGAMPGSGSSESGSVEPAPAEQQPAPAEQQQPAPAEQAPPSAEE